MPIPGPMWCTVNWRTRLTSVRVTTASASTTPPRSVAVIGVATLKRRATLITGACPAVAGPQGQARSGPFRERYRCHPWAVTFLEQDVELADGLVDLPGAGPADREDGAVTGTDVLRLAAVRGDRHPAADDVDGLVGLQLPVGRARGALPDTHLQVALGPGGGARRLHRVAGGLGQGAPVLEFAVQRGGGQERGYRGGVGHGEFGPLSGFQALSGYRGLSVRSGGLRE